jgi:hypothetical protein
MNLFPHQIDISSRLVKLYAVGYNPFGILKLLIKEKIEI